MRSRLLFLRLAVQNLGRHPVRALLLTGAVGIGGCAIFTVTVLRRAVEDSLNVCLNRLGADLLVVPRDTTVNVAAALLTVEPTNLTFDAPTARALGRLPGLMLAAPQRYFALPAASEHGDLDLVVFDPARDFTVMPWLIERLDRPFLPGDVIVGGRRSEGVGGKIALYNRTFPVYGKLGLTGVGPFERSLFVTRDTAVVIAETAQDAIGRSIITALADRYSGLLVCLKAGTRPEQFRFAAAALPQVQVIAGNGLHTSTRQAISTILAASIVFPGLILLTTAMMTAALYSGLIAECRRELGLLMAVGMRPPQLARLILVEAIVTTGLGGICGVILGASGLMFFQRSLGFLFESYAVPFHLPGLSSIAVTALVSCLLCCGVGIAGSLLPALRIGRVEPYALVRGEGS